MTLLSMIACVAMIKFYDWSKRDWTIFTSSIIVGNAYWTLACYTGITVIEWVWKAISQGTL